MIEKIRAHLDALFAGVSRTRRVEDMYQELLAGCLDKYTDLTEGGMGEEDAYEKVIDGIGDVGELLGYVEKSSAFNPVEAAEKRRKRALFTSMGVCGYFIALAAFFLLAFGGSEEVGFAALLGISGLATMVMIYGRMTTVLKYEKADDTLVEEMKEQMTIGNKENKMTFLISSTLWALVVTIYLGISFFSGRWDVTWMIFPFTGVIQNFILAYLNPGDKEKFITGAFWCLIVSVYLLISFITFSWHITWIIFPFAFASQQAVKLYKYWREEK